MARVPPRICWGVFLTALAALLFEVCLTRIFSVTLWYHFGFLAIALAMLGGTAAAMSCFIFRRWLLGDDYQSRLGWSAFLFALAAPVAMVVHFHAPLDEYHIGHLMFFALWGAQFLLLFLVFFAAGLCLTIALAKHAARLNTVYFFDLVGAACGPLLFILLLSWFSAPALVFLVS